MSVSTIDRPVSALRQRMLDDMAMHDLRSDTQRDYIRVCAASPPSSGGRPIRRRLQDIRLFACTSTRAACRPPTINCSVSALRFLLRRSHSTGQDLSAPPGPGALPAGAASGAGTVEEVGRLLEDNSTGSTIQGDTWHRLWCGPPPSRKWPASRSMMARTHETPGFDRSRPSQTWGC